MYFLCCSYCPLGSASVYCFPADISLVCVYIAIVLSLLSKITPKLDTMNLM